MHWHACWDCQASRMRKVQNGNITILPLEHLLMTTVGAHHCSLPPGPPLSSSWPSSWPPCHNGLLSTSSLHCRGWDHHRCCLECHVAVVFWGQFQPTSDSITIANSDNAIVTAIMSSIDQGHHRTQVQSDGLKSSL